MFSTGVPGQQMMGFQQPVSQMMAPAIAYSPVPTAYSQQMPVQQGKLLGDLVVLVFY